MHVVRAFVAGLLVVLLSGCATSLKAPDDLPAQMTGKRLAVANNLDSGLRLAWWGSTAFRPTVWPLQLHDWDPSQTVISHAVQGLKATGRYADIQVVGPIKRDAPAPSQPGLAGYDYLLVIWRGHNDDPLLWAHPAPLMPRYPHRWPMLTTQRVQGSLVLWAELIDVRTGSTVVGPRRAASWPLHIVLNGSTMVTDGDKQLIRQVFDEEAALLIKDLLTPMRLL